MELDEKRIIQDCQNGRQDSFGILYDKYIEKIYRFIYYRTGHKETAEDISSTVFLKALSGIINFKAEEKGFSAWLFTIARNCVADYYRTKKDFFAIEEYWELEDSVHFEDELDAKLKLEEIKKYLNKFNEQQREIILMRIWDQLSYREISEITGMTEAGLKMVVSRIMKKIRKDSSLAGIFIIIGLLN